MYLAKKTFFSKKSPSFNCEYSRLEKVGEELMGRRLFLSHLPTGTFHERGDFFHDGVCRIVGESLFH